MRVRVLYEDGELVSRGKAESKECTGLYNKAWVAGISWDEVLKAAGIEHPWYMFLVKKTVRMFGYRSFRRKFFKDFTSLKLLIRLLLNHQVKYNY